MTVHGTNTIVDPDLLVQVRRECKGTLCVRRNGQPPKTRKFVVASGFGPDHNLGVYNNNVDTIQRALVERYLLCKEGAGFRPALIVASNTYRKRNFKQFRCLTMERMPKLPRLSRQSVVDRYTGAKRAIYQQALYSLVRCGISAADARLLAFIKFEKQDVGKAPRVINPRSVRYNLLLGQFLKHAEKHFFKAINKAFGGHTKATVIKGLNALDSARVIKSKWDRFQNPVAIGLDASKFDMHVSVQALEYEHSFYTALFPGSGLLEQLLEWQKSNRGIAYADDGQVRFKVEGTRCSGDLNTSLGNCIIMCALVWSYLTTRGITAELCNNGDDCVVIMEREDMFMFRSGLDGWFRRHGFAMTVEPPAFDFEMLEFCQTRPVCVNGEWRMVRNHHAVLTKDPMCLIAVQNDTVYRKWLYAVGTGGGILARGVPVQQSFYHAFLRHGIKCSQEMYDQVHKGTSMETRNKGIGYPANSSIEITDQARVSYYYAFGILPDEQREIEKYFDSARFVPLEQQPISRDALEFEPGLKLILN